MTKDTNTNSTKLDSCYSCYSCYSCNYCNYCNYCDSCDYCNYCDSCDSCNSSYGLRMSERMIFCLGEGKYESQGEGYQKNNMVFNTQVTSDEYDKIKSNLPSIKLPITRWVDKKDMTDKEKKDISVWKETSGYLKTLSYKDAWEVAWNEMDRETKDKFLNIPHFNSEIFESITGIDVNQSKEPITIDGKEYSEETIKNALRDYVN